MLTRYPLAAAVLVAMVLAFVPPGPAWSCCAVGGKPVVNADQSVIILWDAESKTEHFIRKASFKAEGDDFGFLVPSPSNPELEESGNAAFDTLAVLTAPEVITKSRGAAAAAARHHSGEAPLTLEVQVVQEKTVAGFHAVVLAADSAGALNGWLKEHGYANSPEVEAWAKPYVEAGWKITAMKVAKEKDSSKGVDVHASALRMSFKTDRPLFPYREPDYKGVNRELGAKGRLLRIFFIADARFGGELTKERAWTGKVAWAGKIGAKGRARLLDELKLPAESGPTGWYVTEFEDNWPYEVAPADVYFSRDAEQKDVRRPAVIRYVEGSGWGAPVTLAVGGAGALVLMFGVAPRVLRGRAGWFR